MKSARERPGVSPGWLVAVVLVAASLVWFAAGRARPTVEDRPLDAPAVAIDVVPLETYASVRESAAGVSSARPGKLGKLGKPVEVEPDAALPRSRGAANRDRDDGPLARLSGQLLDDLGEPIDAFSVAWTRGAPSNLDAASVLDVDDPEGRFRLDVPPSGLWLRFESAGHVASAPERVGGGGGERRWFLDRAVRVEGVVRDTAGAVPANAWVICAAREANGLEDVTHTACSAEGAFTLLAPARGFVVRALAPGFAASTDYAIRARPGAVLVDVVLEVRPPGRIEGVVRDDRGVAVPDAAVWIDAHGATPRRAGDGFVIEDVAPGSYRVGAELQDAGEAGGASRSVTANVEVRAGETTRLVLTCEATRPIELVGTVHATGRVPSGRVTVHPEAGPYARLDVALENGQFRATVDGAGEYLVRVLPERSTSYQDRIVVPDQPTFEVDITLSDSYLSGHVLQPSGAPATGVRLRLEPDPRHGDLQRFLNGGYATSDAGGFFEFEGLAAGVYRLTYPIGELPDGWARSHAAGIELGSADRREGVVLRIPRAGIVRGRARDEDGAAVHAYVRGFDAEGMPQPLRSVAVATRPEDGTFLIEGVRPGPLRLVVRRRDLVAVGVLHELLPGGVVEEDLTLHAGGEVVVSVFERDGRRVGAALRLIHDSGIDFAKFAPPSDQYRIRGVPAGTYELRALNHGGGHVERSVHVRAGESTNVSLVFE
ncbi:MAG: carboxypeptidase regulatory-like domain-containing protein [bacterium]|nr:carboxypeptidase regulatory-like domain-containing protein [bacterium]